jgi:predicted dehydrogenase
VKKIRLGLVGSGGMAAHRAERFRRLDGCDLVGIAARNPETGPALAQKHNIPLLGWPDLLKLADAVAICTHNDTHASLAVQALEARKHVFVEYPVTRSLKEGERLRELAETSGCALRVAHETAVSGTQQALKQRVSSLGGLLIATFVRLTPGRGRRPEVLFNLNVSGPPALFFVYHVYPLVDLFGPAAWVEGSAEYVGLTGSGRYERFVNAVTVGFERGGLGQWTWAGGVEVREAEEFQRIALTGGTLVRGPEGWGLSTPAGVERLQAPPGDEKTLESLFIEDIAKGGISWQADARTAFDAAHIGLAAEASMEEGRRIALKELGDL